MKIARKYIPPISILLISTLGVAYAATNLFTQTFPAIPAVSGITSNCTTLKPSVASVAVGSSGTASFDCSGASPFGTTAAFTVNTPAATISITPQFTLPAPYTSLSLASCGQISLSSGTPLTTGSASYTYCVQYTSAPSTGLPTFDITWTTPTTPFTQTFPAVSATSGITSNCVTLTPFDISNAQSNTFGNHITSVATGSSGFIFFDCSGASQYQTTPAFSVFSPGASIAFTPQFTAPPSYVAVAAFPSFSGRPGACDAGYFPAYQITSGTSVTFSGSGTFAYCVHFQNAPSSGLPTFDITWTT